MRVLCITDRKKIVKGCIYEVYFIQFGVFSIVSILGIGTFDPILFTLEDGSPIPKNNWNSPEYEIELSTMISLEGKEITIGDLLIYRYENSKILISGKKYRVRDVKRITADTHVITKIKVDGHNTWLYCGGFRKCTIEEERELNLNLIFDNNKENLKVDKDCRKIMQYSESRRKFILFKLLTSSILDKSRNNMNIISWAIRKGSKYQLIESDFDIILNKNLNDVLIDFDKIDLQSL